MPTRHPMMTPMLTHHFQRALLVAAVLASTTAAAQSARESFSVIRSKQSILETLLDPKSARFRKLFLSEHGDSKVTLCGEVNSKDRTGKYVGFRRFMVDDLEESMLDPTDAADSGQRQTIFDRVYKQACSNKFKDVKWAGSAR